MSVQITLTIPQLVQMLVRTFPAGLTVEMMGGPGIGKTSAVEQACAMLSRVTNKRVGLVTNILSGMDPTEIRGYLVMSEGETPKDHFLPGVEPATRAAEFTYPPVFPNRTNITLFEGGEKKGFLRDVGGELPTIGVVFLDEFGQAPHDVQKPAAQLILERRVGDYILPNGWVVWAASNRTSDRAGVVKKLTHVTNRRKEVYIRADLRALLNYLGRKGVHHTLLSFAEAHPDVVLHDEVPAGEGQFCTPRTLELCAEELKTLALTAQYVERGADGDPLPGATPGPLPEDMLADTSDPIVQSCVFGWLGGEAATKLLEHIDLFHLMPTWDEIVEDPAKAKLPPNDRPDAIYATATMMAHRVEADTAEQMFVYLDRLPKEFGLSTILSIQARWRGRTGKTPLSTKAFSKWVSENHVETATILAATGNMT